MLVDLIARAKINFTITSLRILSSTTTSQSSPYNARRTDAEPPPTLAHVPSRVDVLSRLGRISDTARPSQLNFVSTEYYMAYYRDPSGSNLEGVRHSYSRGRGRHCNTVCELSRQKRHSGRLAVFKVDKASEPRNPLRETLQLRSNFRRETTYRTMETYCIWTGVCVKKFGVYMRERQMRQDKGDCKLLPLQKRKRAKKQDEKRNATMQKTDKKKNRGPREPYCSHGPP